MQTSTLLASLRPFFTEFSNDGRMFLRPRWCWQPLQSVIRLPWESWVLLQVHQIWSSMTHRASFSTGSFDIGFGIAYAVSIVCGVFRPKVPRPAWDWECPRDYLWMLSKSSSIRAGFLVWPFLKSYWWWKSWLRRSLETHRSSSKLALKLFIWHTSFLHVLVVWFLLCQTSTRFRFKSKS